jgi:hypothetical protein
MVFRRQATAAELPEGAELTRALAGIGVRLAAEPLIETKIEDELLAASIEGMEREDLRVLSLLVTWLGAHASRVNLDRLTRAVRAQRSPRVRAFWSAIARWQQKDPRWRRLAKAYRGPRVELLRTGNAFQVARRGEDGRFASGPLQAPAGTLRDRPQDVLTAQELARVHRTYRLRVQMGPSYRADMWAELTANPALRPADLARKTYGSFATASEVRVAWAILAHASRSQLK